MRISRLAIAILLVFVSCETSQSRSQECDLDLVNAKGDISKIELITQSDMPVSEMVYNFFDYDCTYSYLFGNNSVVFDKSGFIKHQTVYDNSGKVLFQGSCAPGAKKNLLTGLFFNKEYSNMRLENDYDKDGRLSLQKFYQKDSLIVRKHLTYNEYGDISRIEAQYPTLGFKSEFVDYEWLDNTYIDYTKRDSLGNWLEANIVFKGNLSRHDYQMKVKRAITYWSEKSQNNLVDQLNQFIKEGHREPLSTQVSSYCFGGSLYGVVPNNFTAGDPLSLPEDRYVCFYSTITEDHATIAFERDFTDVENIKGLSAYDKEIERQMVKALSDNGIYVLVWQGVSERQLNGRDCAVTKYIRLGQGSPIPVEVEIYQFIARGYIYRITISWQSSKRDKYSKLLRDCVEKVHM